MKRVTFFRMVLLGACLNCASAFFPAPVFAQSPGDPGEGGQDEQDSDTDGIKGWWECECPGGNFVVKLSDIASVSKHTYVVDGVARVYEVTVDTRGQMTGRFYYVEPVTSESPLAIGKLTLDRIRSLTEDASKTAGVANAWTEVVKNYPQTTHAKTAEYRVSGVDQIEKIYRHVYRVWAEEKGHGTDNKVVAN